MNEKVEKLLNFLSFLEEMPSSIFELPFFLSLFRTDESQNKVKVNPIFLLAKTT